MLKTGRGSPSDIITQIAQRNIGKNKPLSTIESIPCQNRTLEIKEGDWYEEPIKFTSGIRDLQPLMLVPLFSLSKKIDLSGLAKVYPIKNNRYICIAAGPSGLPTIWDYDLILVVISQFTHQIDEHKAGRRSKPGKTMIMKTSDILNFCQRGTGGSQRARLIPALKRLMETKIHFFSYHSGCQTLEDKPKPLIQEYRIIKDKNQLIEINISDWMIEMITKQYPKLSVLHMHDRYFELGAVERFLYRFARCAAGAREWEWGLDKIYERSGSLSNKRKFYELLRRAIFANKLPEYEVEVRAGRHEPILVMKNRKNLNKKISLIV